MIQTILVVMATAATEMTKAIAIALSTVLNYYVYKPPFLQVISSISGTMT